MGGDFDWEVHPELDRFVQDHVSVFLKRNRFASGLSAKMLDVTSTRFVDWVDHMVIPESSVSRKDLESLGLYEVKTDDKPEGTVVFRHMGSYLFPILLSSNKETEIAIKPESIDDFLQVLGLGIKVEGTPFSPFRKAVVNKDGDYILSAVERRGYGGFVIKDYGDVDIYAKALSAFYTRRRHFDNDTDGIIRTKELIESHIKTLDSARVADAFFRAERSYWQKRNRAGQVQKARQDALGLGWGNHDHHTYRSSRENFVKMIDMFESMGYLCREKYYAGEKAGWGAQILEHSVCNIVVFTDVDLNPDETQIDFSHIPFPEKETRLGTVGLWIGLHGESILQAGMHHLEARFMFEKLTGDLGTLGIEVMPPFSHFDFLKQAFTKGEKWPVERKRLDLLLTSKYITQEQYDDFLKGGAIGSHMENLERDQGFKGFNRSSVTKIILATDPRKHQFVGA
ncbi:MAG: hypothetical protein ACREBH_03335 [Candidatus Micrarchaeaceae archaeon]